MVVAVVLVALVVFGTITSSVSLTSRTASTLRREPPITACPCRTFPRATDSLIASSSAIVARSTIAAAPATLRGRPVHSRV